MLEKNNFDNVRVEGKPLRSVEGRWKTLLLLLSIFLPFYLSTCISTRLYASDYDKQIKAYKQKIKKSRSELIGVQSEISHKENNIKTIKKKEASLETHLENIIRKLETTKAELLKTKISINKKQFPSGHAF